MAVEAMRLPVSRIIPIVCALLVAVPATAAAATTPKVTSVAPLHLKIGERLTLRGKGFLPGKNRNTVVFKATGGRAVFAKAESATTTKLVVKVPAKLAAFLKLTAGRPTATRFQLRVLARKLSPSYTPGGSSPTIAPATSTATTPALKAPAVAPAPAAAAAPAPSVVAAPAPDCDGDGTPDATDTDDDNDLLSDATERSIGTATCAADTDGDGMEDGWEYQSAKDFNRESCPAAGYPTVCPGAKPYPYKRPYTNPLFQDAGQDYDGDYLAAGFEYAAWKKHGVRSLDNMWYSDGLQSSLDSDPNDSCAGLTEDPATGHVDKYPTGLLAYPSRTQGLAYEAPPTPRYEWLYGHAQYSLDTDGALHPNHGCLSDEERDEDGDFLSNREENNTMMTGPAFVQALFSEPAFKTLFGGTDPMDADTDGDGIVDGMDDEDQDDFWNVEEIDRGTESSVEAGDTAVRTGLWVDPYNPCLPAIHSRSCPKGVLLGGTPWRPFYEGDTPPLRRWPLYNTPLFAGAASTTPQDEIWGPVPANEQKLPLQQPGDPDATRPEHPLLPRPA
jgi:hypothetical protein